MMLDDIGLRLWEVLAQPVLLSAAVELLCREFGGEPGAIAADIRAMVDTLAIYDLLMLESLPRAVWGDQCDGG